MKQVFLPKRQTAQTFLVILSLALASMLNVQAQNSGLTEIVIGDGTETSCEIPFNACTGGWSYAESIYPAGSIGDPCLIKSVSFSCAETPIQYGYSFPFSAVACGLFIGTTSRTSYSSTTDWTSSSVLQNLYDRPHWTWFSIYDPEHDDLYNDGWITFELDQPYSYEGDNLVVGLTICSDPGIGDKGHGKDGNYTPLSIYGSTVTNGTLSVRNTIIYTPDFVYPPTSDIEGQLSNIRPNIKLGVLSGPSFTSVPNQIDLGIRPSGCWMAPVDAVLTNNGMVGTLTSAPCDNNFFNIGVPELPMNIATEGTVPYSISGGTGSGEQTGTLTFTYGNNKTLEVPLSATAYTPVTPDVWELAREVTTFPYSETITSDMAVYDNYQLPGDNDDDKDVVFQLNFEEDVVSHIVVSSNGNGKFALYKDDFEGQGGPSKDNAVFGFPMLSESVFESGSFPDEYNWVHDANYPWVITNANSHDGLYCIKSGNQGRNSTSSSLSVTREYSQPTTMSFWAKISSEGGCDFGYFSIDGIGMEDVNGISGNGDWCHYAYYISAGTHTFNWTFVKDDSYHTWIPQNDDCFYVDQIVFDSDLSRTIFIPEGVYYLVASSTSEVFSIEINQESAPLPEPIVSCFPANINFYQDNPAALTWQLGKYTTEYQLLFGETNPPQNVLVDWTDQLEDHFDIEVEDTKTYYWCVNERNSSGITNGSVYMFSTFKSIQASTDNIIYVTPTGAGVKDGSSWGNAVSGLQAAIDAASAVTDNKPAVWVSKGTYYTDGSSLDIDGNACCFLAYGQVKLYGGFNGDEQADYDLSQRDFESNASILDAEGKCYVAGARACLWDGFVMQNGKEGGLYSATYSSKDSTYVKNCIIQYSEGCGFYARNRWVVFENNILSHHALDGISSDAGLWIKDCTISDNGRNGVAGFNCICLRCIISNNAGSGFSAKYGAIVGCLVANNDGEGTSCNYILSSTIVNNGVGFNGNTVVLCNSIVWGNETLASVNWNKWNPGMVSNNAIQGDIRGKNGIYPCLHLAGSANEAGLSPEFEHPASGVGSAFSDGVWTLKATSPCINMGMNLDLVPMYEERQVYFNEYLDVDLAGNQRVIQDRIDIGAFESPYAKADIQYAIQPDVNNIIYVKTDGQGNGSSWESATSDLHQAIEIAALYDPSPTIWVAQGVYSIGNYPFQIKQSQRLHGGFVGNEPSFYDLKQRDLENHASILDGNNIARVLNQSNGLLEKEAALVDGFTIRNGTAANGAGIYLLKNGTLSRCTVENNATIGTNTKGGGVYSDEAIIQDCFIRNNSANQGGGIYAVNSSIIQSHVGNNTAESGGGLYAQNTVIAQCNIVKNQGGGLYIYAENNNDFVRMSNSIVWGNEGNQFKYLTSYALNNTSMNHCAIMGLQNNDNGNIPLSSDNEGVLGPRFVSPSAVTGNTDLLGNWNLQATSPCVDAGSNTIPGMMMPNYDIQYNSRIQNGDVDMGAYESPYDAQCLLLDVREARINSCESYDFYGTYLSEPRTYERRWTVDGCDSLVILHLHVADLIYVTENGAGNKDGSSWSDALDGNTQLSNGYTKLADALASASPYTEFWLSSGHYYPCKDLDAQKCISLNEGVRLFGGFAGTETSIANRVPETDPTVFSGELQDDNVADNNSECVIVTSLETDDFWTIPAVLDKITISDGYASTHKGAALRVNPNTFVSLNNCSVVGNHEGGVYNQGLLSIGNSDLSNNNSELFGEYYGHLPHHIYYYNAGAICNMETGVANVDNCTFLSNHSPHNGAICNDGMMNINASVFDNNTADCFGAIFSPGKIKVHNTTFNNNRSDHYIAVMWAWDSLEMVNCNITNNFSNYYTSTHFPTGGAANFNSRRTSGVQGDGYSRIVNCSFINNDAGTCPGGALSIIGTADVKNCVFRENTGQRPWRDPETGGNIGSVVVIGNPDGGGLFVSGSARVSDCEFTDNKAYRGHSIGVWGGPVIMERCKIVNSVDCTGGGRGAIATQGDGNVLTVNNSLIVNNSNVILFQIGNGHTTINNTTIANNNGEAAFWFNSVSETSVIELNNSILSGYPATLQISEVGEKEGTVVMHNTLCHQPVSGGENDPLFVNPTDYLGYDENVNPLENYDWRLQDNSPCINAGNASLLTLDPLAIDLAGEPRVKNGTIDQGAYEYGTTFMFIHDGDWTEASNWNVNEVPQSTDDAFIKANCQLNDNVTIASLSVDYEQSLTVKPGKTLNVTGALTNAEASAMVVEDGAQLVYNHAVDATLKKDISAHGGEGGWYFIASPVNTATAPSALGHLISPVTANYDLYYYDEPSIFWRNYKTGTNNLNPGFNIEPMKGYLYANAANITLLMEGNMHAANATLNTELSLQSNDAELHGFNLVGNPFTHNLTSGDIQIGETDLTTYYIVENGSEIVAKQISEDPIKPGRGFIVQATADKQQLVFNPSDKSRGEQPGVISIAAGDNVFTDMAYVQIGGGNTLQKMTLADNTQEVFIQHDSKNYAAVTLDAAEGEVPLGFKAVRNGEYTLTVNLHGLEMSYLHLVDNMTGTDVDLLLNPSYTFDARHNDYTSRFRLVFQAQNTNHGDDNFAFLSNGQIVINGAGNAILQVIDVTGRVIDTYYDINRIGTEQLAGGLYILRLINGDEVKTQKLVVR